MNDQELIQAIAAKLDCHPAFILESIEQLQEWLKEQSELAYNWENAATHQSSVICELRAELETRRKQATTNWAWACELEAKLQEAHTEDV